MPQSEYNAQVIIRSDLKPENILLENNSLDNIRIKIIDFGTSLMFKSKQKFFEKAGTVFLNLAFLYCS